MPGKLQWKTEEVLLQEPAQFVEQKYLKLNQTNKHLS